MSTIEFSTQAGRPFPLGATPLEGGVNFALFSANAEKVELCLFDEVGQVEIARIPLSENTDQVWHVYVEGLEIGALYGYRVYGPYEPQRGHRFNPNKLLLDPYAKKIDGFFRWSDVVHGYKLDNPHQDLVMDKQDSANAMPKCRVSCLDVPVWDADTLAPAPNISWQKSVIYEAHVKGLTQLKLSVPANLRGTYAGLAHPEIIEYLCKLGITAIELLPVHSFIDEHFLTTQNLSNYWGYNTLNFFSVHDGYSSTGKRSEFKTMVNAMHRAGIEVILDVVYNHTAEGNHLGPTLSFRGIDNASYYCLQTKDSRYYVNDTGCGNTLNIKHPRVLQMVMDSLRYWVTEMGVDGFRFDLATVLGREEHGFDPGSGFFDSIRQDPSLAGVKLIAEPWDIGPGGYQLGNYPVGWSEWNDRYRDTCRKFWRGDPGMLPEFARRIHGSSDIFEHKGKAPSASINLMTSHDGFTLHDLVSYRERRNEANQEQNKDGHHANFSEHYGVEGETNDPSIIKIRERQKRNFLATLFLSQGTPMLLGGDEFGRTQKGNNNAYCQDNEINWIDWQGLGDNNFSQIEFTSYLAQLRREYPLLTAKQYIHRPEDPSEHENRAVRWFSPDGEEMSQQHWAEAHVHTVGWMLEQMDAKEKGNVAQRILIVFNASAIDVEFKLPADEFLTEWQCLLDTMQEDGKPKQRNLPKGAKIFASPKSMYVLEASLIACQLNRA